MYSSRTFEKQKPTSVFPLIIEEIQENSRLYIHFLLTVRKYSPPQLEIFLPSISLATTPKFNIAPENWWLEDEISF